MGNETRSIRNLEDEKYVRETKEDFEPYRSTAKQVASYFNTNLEHGLSEKQVKDYQSKYGENTLGEEKGIPYGRILAHQLFNAMILVLFASMVIALAIRDWISGGVIGFVVFLNVSVGCFQEIKAEKTMGSLRSLSSPSARVIREGNDMVIPASELVPGDIVSLNVGDTVPSDLRLISCMNFETDEALLTGESLPIAKDADLVYDTNELVAVGDRLNLAYSSSVVAKGRALGISVSIGLDTEIGKIAESLRGQSGIIRKVDKSNNRKPRKREYTYAFFGSIKDIFLSVLGLKSGTPLQKSLALLAIGLFWIAVVLAIVVLGSQKMNVTREVAIYAISVALSMIPSSLLVVLTITMAIGAKNMVKRHVVVRKLDSLEALGGIDDICSDKTGTLTQGKMIVKKVWIPNIGTYSVENTNEPYNPTIGDICFSKYSPSYITRIDEEIDFSYELPKEPTNFTEWVHCASLANIATLIQDVNSDTGEIEYKAHGDATEIAIQVFVARSGYSKQELEKEYKHVHEYPFDSSIKRMSALYENRNTGEWKVFSKGGVESLLSICTHWLGHSDDYKDDYDKNYDNQKQVKITESDKKMIEDNVDKLSSQGLRVLAFGTKNMKPGDHGIGDRQSVETDLVFQGLVGIYDPPRLETASSVKKCRNAKINVHMLTGDHPGTAKAIAQEVGILPRNLYHYSEDVVKAMCMTAHEFDLLSDMEVDELPILPLVIARCAPHTKVRMIDALHRRKKFAAMTGDGVNDSPSLKKADVGIAMGMNGSDVAKDVSDIVLTDDNFASILNAIEEGRRMTTNIKKFILHLLAVNIAQAFYLMIGLAFVDDSGFSVFPLSPVEVLWLIVITSCFPAMGLGQEKAQEDILEHAPSNKIFTAEVIFDMMGYGFLMAVSCLITFVIVVYGKGNGDLGVDCNESLEGCDLVFRGRSAAFATMTWDALILAWECIHQTHSLFKMKLNTDNPWWKQTALDLWGNQVLFWSVMGGAVSVFPVVYIPVINDYAFLHKGIGYEWGVAIALTVFFLGCAECWKWGKRVFFRHRQKVSSDAVVNDDPFERFASISRATSTDKLAYIV